MKPFVLSFSRMSRKYHTSLSRYEWFHGLRQAQAERNVISIRAGSIVAFKEVEDALVAVRTAQDQRKAQQDQVDALRSALQVADLRYQAGITNYVEALIAKLNLFAAESALTAARRLHLVSVVQFYKTLGGRWSSG